MNRMNEQDFIAEECVEEEFIPGENMAVFRVTGEIDHHRAKAVRTRIDGSIAKLHPMTVRMDLSGVSFMDSAGLGLILGRYAKVSQYGGRMLLVNPSSEIMKIIALAGVDKLIEIEKDGNLPEKKGS